MSDGDATEEITLDELIQLGIAAHMAEVHVAMPAVVRSYDRAKGTVEVSLPVNPMVPDGSGNYVSDPLPVLGDVPIEWPRCGKFSITFPLEAGDTGMIVCCERNISAWRLTGQPSDCGDVGMHTLDGAVFRPGLAADKSPPTTADASNMVLGSTTDAKGRLVCKPAGGQLGQGATSGIAREGDDVSVAAISAATPTSLTFSVVDSLGVSGTINITVAGGALVVVLAPPTMAAPFTMAGAIDTSSSTWTCED